MACIKSIIINEIANSFIVESLNKKIVERDQIDTNGGNLYEPEGLDLNHVRLFENEDELYISSLEDSYWKEISDKFPNYNVPDSEDNTKAVNHVLKGMKNKYSDKDWSKMEDKMRSKISGGIT